ncbi:MAG: hypothetical protein UZ06_CHB003000969 [Chlorobi bacterium OLB6]|nr:MAG: hypothetical protein UZ06_CHB003000969 [Chlorobi bacterium OLB6]
MVGRAPPGTTKVGEGAIPCAAVTERADLSILSLSGTAGARTEECLDSCSIQSRLQNRNVLQS